jgi:hypothetical protein
MENREGFTKEIDQGVAELSGEGEIAWNSQVKIEWYRRSFAKPARTSGTASSAAGLLEGNWFKGSSWPRRSAGG